MSNTPAEQTPITAVANPSFMQSTNPMDRDAMQFLYELGCRSRDYKVQEINGAIYVNTDGLERIDKYEPPALDTFAPRTLSGLVDWLKADLDKLFELFDKLYVHVDATNNVKVYSPVHTSKNRRDLLAECEYTPPPIKFDNYMGQEDFLIMLQTRFCEGPNRDALAKTVGNLRISDEMQLADDGISQRVTVKTGVASIAEVPFENPVHLAPRRTFPEVEQPSSPFIVRFKKEGAAAIYEADGGAWKITAITAVGEWLKEQLDGLPVVIIA